MTNEAAIRICEAKRAEYESINDGRGAGACDACIVALRADDVRNRLKATELEQLEAQATHLGLPFVRSGPYTLAEFAAMEPPKSNVQEKEDAEDARWNELSDGIEGVLTVSDVRPTCEDCGSTGYVQLGDRNTGQSYRCDTWGGPCAVLDWDENRREKAQVKARPAVCVECKTSIEDSDLMIRVDGTTRHERCVWASKAPDIEDAVSDALLTRGRSPRRERDQPCSSVSGAGSADTTTKDVPFSGEGLTPCDAEPAGDSAKSAQTGPNASPARKGGLREGEMVCLERIPQSSPSSSSDEPRTLQVGDKGYLEGVMGILGPACPPEEMTRRQEAARRILAKMTRGAEPQPLVPPAPEYDGTPQPSEPLPHHAADECPTCEGKGCSRPNGPDKFPIVRCPDCVGTGLRKVASSDMTVKELIAALRKLPPDLNVRVWDHEQDDYVPVVMAFKESGVPYVDLLPFDPTLPVATPEPEVTPKAHIGGRAPMPEIGESALNARARGCNVSYSVPDHEFVRAIEDHYPDRWAWSIQWSNGVSTGVREETPSAPVSKPRSTYTWKERCHCKSAEWPHERGIEGCLRPLEAPTVPEKPFSPYDPECQANWLTEDDLRTLALSELPEPEAGTGVMSTADRLRLIRKPERVLTIMRETRGLSLKDMAEAAGLAVWLLRALESGAVKPTQDHLRCILAACVEDGEEGDLQGLFDTFKV